MSWGLSVEVIILNSYTEAMLGGLMDSSISISDVEQCLADVTRYLHLMAHQAVVFEHNISEEYLVQGSMMSEKYSLKFVCQSQRFHRFLAIMSKPYEYQFLLGRLLRNGKVWVFQNGILHFFCYLYNERIYRDFHYDLSEALNLAEFGKDRKDCI